MAKTYHAIGLMSGSSLDGLDIAHCSFTFDGDKVDWQLHEAEVVGFDPKWMMRLKKLYSQDALTFMKTHTYFGYYMGEIVNDFVKRHNLDPDFVASHGHSVFHEPENRMTTQIGDGAALAAMSGLPVVCDFRATDVALFGEGAPLAPIADAYLFPGYDLYLNIGGIVNISANIDGRMVAFDVCAGNTVLNFAAGQLGLSLDNDGDYARHGNAQVALMEEFSQDPYFTQAYPKSLSNKWVQSRMIPILLRHRLSPEDKLASAVEHIAIQVAEAVRTIKQREGLEDRPLKMFITGGGGFNSYLLERIHGHCNVGGIQTELELPESNIIKFKEALLIAFMGALRVENRYNVLASCTGARQDTISGALYQGVKKFV